MYNVYETKKSIFNPSLKRQIMAIKAASHKITQTKEASVKSKGIPIPTMTLLLCALAALSLRPNYAKRTQFHSALNQRNPRWKKGLPKNPRPGLGKKQTQTKPISDYPCVVALAVYNLILRDGNVRNLDRKYSKWQMHQERTQ